MAGTALRSKLQDDPLRKVKFCREVSPLFAEVDRATAPPLFTVPDRQARPVVSSVTVCPLSTVTVSAEVGTTPPAQVLAELQGPDAALLIAAIYSRPICISAITPTPSMVPTDRHAVRPIAKQRVMICRTTID